MGGDEVNAVDEIEAAIAKLTEIQSFQPLVVNFSNVTDPVMQEWLGRVEFKLAMFNRTMDAQLRVLQFAKYSINEGEWSEAHLPAELLARAINGTA